MSTPPIVIIADPDTRISSVLRVEFTRWGFAVFLAATGEEAQVYAAHAVAHLIVIDTKLQLGAYEACVRIRRRAGYAACPIVLTANDSSPKVREVAKAAGATVVLPKPFSVTDLVNAIRPFLPPTDLLFAHRPEAPVSKEWFRKPDPAASLGGDSLLLRNGQLMPIVRSKGVSILVVRKP